jgi:hypothetical protein
MWPAVGWNLVDAVLLYLRLKFIILWNEQYILWLIEKNTEENDGIYCSQNIITVIKSRKLRWAGLVSRFGNVRLLNKIECEEHKGRRDLQELGHRWEGIFQIDLTEMEYEILTLMQVVRMGSGGGLRFENDKESSCITRKRPNVLAIVNYRTLLRLHKRLCH